MQGQGRDRRRKKKKKSKGKCCGCGYLVACLFVIFFLLVSSGLFWLEFEIEQGGMEAVKPAHPAAAAAEAVPHVLGKALSLLKPPACRCVRNPAYAAFDWKLPIVLFTEPRNLSKVVIYVPCIIRQGFLQSDDFLWLWMKEPESKVFVIKSADQVTPSPMNAFEDRQ